jgi:HSP20 family molecular chaperone IbpA
MQNNNGLNQQGTGCQQLKFMPISSNVSYVGTTVTYGIGNGSQANAFNGGNNYSGNWHGGSTTNTTNLPITGINASVTPILPTVTGITPNTGLVSGTMGIIPATGLMSGTTAFTPVISASQYNQLGSGFVNTNLYNNHYGRGTMVQPTIEISETSSDIVVSAYVSDYAVNDLNLNVTQDSVTLSGSVVSGNNLFVLNRTVPLSTSVRAEAVDATLQSGVLEIRLPKTEKVSRNKPTVGKDVNQR